MLLAIDPGKDQGWALFDGTTLRTCGLGAAPILQFSDTCAPLEVIIECPQFYKTSNPTAIAGLLRLVGRLEQIADSADVPYKLVSPHAWKGNVAKPVMLARIVSKLTPAELDVLDRCGVSKGKRHNVVDAVGLGLYALGRL